MSEKKYHKRFAGHDLNRRRNTAAHIGADLSGWLAAHGMRPQQTLLGQLWRNWDIVTGPDIAPIARPLGHRNGILLIGETIPALCRNFPTPCPRYSSE